MNKMTKKSSIVRTVGLADDQQLVRAGFSLVLESQDDIEVVWQADDGAQAIELAVAHPVDVILMDVQMPTLDGIAATAAIVDKSPTGPAGEFTRIVVLTTFDNDNYVLGAVQAGASGFLLKDTDPEDLISAVRAVGESSAVVSPKATARLLRRVRTGVQTSHANSSDLDLPEPLTRREEEILKLMAQGLNNHEISRRLFISMPTVKTHVGRVLAKTGSRDRVHAVLFAVKHGFVTPDELLVHETPGDLS